MYTLAISVDLSNWECRQAIQDYLCKLQSKDPSIVSIVYDKTKNVVRVSGAFDPNDLKRMLISKLRDKINSIDIQEPPDKPDAPPPARPPSEPPKEKPNEPPKEQPKPPMYPWPPKQPMYPWPPQVTMVCFAPPCPCLPARSDNYRCCSCGEENRPRWCGSGSGSRCSGSRHRDHPQWGYEPSQQPNIVYESTEQSCSIM